MAEMQKAIMETLEVLREAIQDYAQATLRKLKAKEALEEALAQAVMAGEVQGRNEEERKAKARMLLADHYRELARAEEALIWAKARLDIAKYWFEGLSALAHGGREFSPKEVL